MWRPVIRVVMVRRLVFDGSSAKKSPHKWLVVGSGGPHRFQRQGHHCQARLPPWDKCRHFADAAHVVCISPVSGHDLVGGARPSGLDAMTRQDWFGTVGLGSGLIFCSAVTCACYLTYSGQLVQRLGSLHLTG